MKRRFFYPMLFIAVITASPLHAQDGIGTAVLDELVVTATLSETPLDRIPAAVEVIGKEEIAEMGASTLQQVLTEAQGVVLEVASGRMSTAGLRGLGSSRTLVLIDGMRLPTGFQDKADMGEIPVSFIERIEIVRGPVSALYGSEAIGGVINVITRKPSDKPLAWFGAQYGESRNGEAAGTLFDGGVSGREGRLGYVLTGSFSDKERFDFDQEDWKTDGDDKKIGAGAAMFTWDFGDGTDLAAGVTYADVDRYGVRPKRQTEHDWRNRSGRFTGMVSLRTVLAPESVLFFRASRSEYDWGVTLTPLENTMLPTPAHALLESEIHDVDQVTDQYEARWTGKLLNSHKLTAGIEYRTEERQEDGVSSEIDNLGLFLQDEVSVTGRLRAILGLRFDDHSGFGSVYSPRIGVTCQLTDYLRLRGAYAEGFRAPSAFELYSGSPYTVQRILVPNPDLDPETSRTWEVGADIEHGALRVNLTAFRNDIDDMIAEVFTGRYEGTRPAIPVNEMRNIAETMTRGIEVSLGLDLGCGFFLSDELSLLDGENRDTGEELLYIPDVSNVLKLSYGSHDIGFSGNVRLVTTGSQYTGGEEKNGSYSLVNVFASQSLTTGARLFAGVDNLFDRMAGEGYGNVYGPGSSGMFVYGGVRLNL
ncbi:hypothetical protein CHL67_08850 [Prosthecochloris sp. GSB1]|uniref:TonB-dependent receptor plug domain-containing protein n=1 Tax=Prosthecochloris sp. GSB1 TaxID=281093 RepID=UPI000B8CE276|nr:TonB-dependent receptor [Prosthecochloris sp. GSB1]ASQ91012.1 hypothetical protein CHL67_08850 [Prosthecochloris sp. GSB1]